MLGLENWGLWGLLIGTFLSATVIPVSSDAMYIAVLVATGDFTGCLISGTLGNWLGSVVTFYMGRLGKWEWIEKVFRVKPETLQKQKKRIDKYGVWLALLAWVPFLGDVIALALGFYRTKQVPTIALLLIGKFTRFLVWNAILAGTVIPAA